MEIPNEPIEEFPTMKKLEKAVTIAKAIKTSGSEDSEGSEESGGRG